MAWPYGEFDSWLPETFVVTEPGVGAATVTPADGFYPPALVDMPEWHPWITQIVPVVNDILDGKINSCFTLTLAENVDISTVTYQRIRPNSALVLVPLTPNAAAAMGTLYQDFPNVTDGVARLNHANNSQTDRTFRCIALG